MEEQKREKKKPDLKDFASNKARYVGISNF